MKSAPQNFGLIDEDGSGGLDLEEIVRAFQKLPLRETSEDEVRARFTKHGTPFFRESLRFCKSGKINERLSWPLAAVLFSASMSQLEVPLQRSALPD